MKLILTNVRMAFPEIFKAVQFNGEGEHKFSSTFIIDGDDDKLIQKIKDTIKAVAADKWDDEIPGKATFNKEKCCSGKGDDMDKVYDGFAGNVFIRASNKQKPKLRNRNPKEEVFEEDGTLYGGCYVNAVLDVWAQDNNWGKRVNASLQAIQFVRGGEAFGGGAIPDNVADEFDDIAEEFEEELDEMFD